MPDSLASLQQRTDRAADLQSVVRTMKALSASNITQYENAVVALHEYYHTVELGLMACLQQRPLISMVPKTEQAARETIVIVFGTDQGLVGQFNDQIMQLVQSKSDEFKGTQTFWAIGERVYDHLIAADIPVAGQINLPNSVSTITDTIGHILHATTEEWHSEQVTDLYLFHHRPSATSGQYEPHWRRLLPLDNQWQLQIQQQPWPSNKLPQSLGNEQATLSALVREYLFVCLYQACAESLASEHASRLAAMQRADQNIDEMLAQLQHVYHQQRQNQIDSELFDVIASFTQ